MSNLQQKKWSWPAKHTVCGYAKFDEIAYLQASVPAVSNTPGENPSGRVLYGVETLQRATRIRDERLAHLNNQCTKRKQSLLEINIASE